MPFDVYVSVDDDDDVKLFSFNMDDLDRAIRTKNTEYLRKIQTHLEKFKQMVVEKHPDLIHEFRSDECKDTLIVRLGVDHVNDNVFIRCAKAAKGRPGKLFKLEKEPRGFIITVDLATFSSWAEAILKDQSQLKRSFLAAQK